MGRLGFRCGGEVIVYSDIVVHVMAAEELPRASGSAGVSIEKIIRRENVDETGHRRAFQGPTPLSSIANPASTALRAMRSPRSQSVSSQRGSILLMVEAPRKGRIFVDYLGNHRAGDRDHALQRKITSRRSCRGTIDAL